MQRLEAVARRVGRALVGEDTRAARVLRRHYHTLNRRIARKQIGPNYICFWAGRRRDRRIGIYLKGGCDVLSLFACQPLIQRSLDGTCCILREGEVSSARSDFILQSLRPLPAEWTRPVAEQLELPPDYFRSQLFSRNMHVAGEAGTEEFPKRIVVLSIAPDVVRSLYRHRQHGFLVDPGGWWLNQSLTRVLADRSRATWFRETFESIGKLDVAAFYENFTTIIELVKAVTEAHILVLNVLTVEPGSLVYNYQFVRNASTIRHHEFNLALVELSRKLDFSILDMDRLLKGIGVDGQVDFGHFPPDRYQPIAGEAVRIMKDLGVV